jgi:3-phosphoshikimate 1-carboxyvinyltransferase
MKVEVFPSAIAGSISIPGSKSLAQRLVAGALLAKGETTLHHFPESKDCQAALNMAQALGAVVVKTGNTVSIKGGFPNSSESGIRNPKLQLNGGESGLASRLFIPLATLYDEPITISGIGSLLDRPFQEYEKTLPQLGVKVKSNKGFLPITVTGPMKGGKAQLDGSLSSQFLTGLLFAAPLCSENVELEVADLKSIPYVDLTLEVLSFYGVKCSRKGSHLFKIAANQNYTPKSVSIDGDWSGAAFLLVAAALCSETGVRITNLSSDFTQADTAILDALRLAGVSIRTSKGIEVRKSTVHAFEFDATDCPDLFPPLAALAAVGDGVTTIKGVHRLIHKESNRAKALVDEFAKANIRILIRDDEMKIYPGHIRPANINSHNDHRIAMAGAVLGLVGDKMTIAGAECVAKSYPNFWTDLEALGARINIK